MQSGSKFFKSFISFFESEGILTSDDIDLALKSLGGVEGVISERFYIFGYEKIGWFLANKMALSEQLSFLSNNHKLLLEHRDERYYFVEALIDQTNLKYDEKVALINSVPSSYAKYLRLKFI